MVADALPDLVDPEDPASLLDVLPARGREHRSWADKIINDAIFRAVSAVSSLPDSDGALGSPLALKLHPKDLRTGWLEAWASCPARPRGWIHHSVDRTSERRLKAERLLDQAQRRARELPEWLEALCAARSIVGSAAAVVLAARIIADEPARHDDVRRASIVLTATGDLAVPVRGVIFLPTPGIEVSDDLVFVHPNLLDVPGTEDALRALGIEPVDQSGRLRSLIKQLFADWDDRHWTEFWGHHPQPRLSHRCDDPFGGAR